MVQLSRNSAIFIATAVLILYLFQTPIQILRSTDFKKSTVSAIDISADEGRFAEVKKLLPGNSSVGYLGKNNNGLFEKQYDVSKDFSVAQYALIPTILTIGTKPALIIGDLQDRQTAEKLIKQNRLIIKKDFHNGIYLLGHKK
jgi:hypothetical protein